jgi:PAS domain S-box-containing protein
MIFITNDHNYILKGESLAEKESEQERIQELLKRNMKGLTIEEVSKKLSLNRATAAKYLNGLVISGQADMRSLGPAKLFYLTSRLPLTNILSLSSDLILIIDNDHFIQEANDSFLTFFHVAKEELKGAQMEHSPLAPFFSPVHFEALNTALEGREQSFEVSFGIQDADRFFKMKYLPLVFEGGKPAVGVILEDITEMKKYQNELEEGIQERTEKLVSTNDALQQEIKKHIQAEQALRESDERFRQVADMANEWIWEVDETGMFRYCSAAIRRILGFRPEDLVGKCHYYDLFTPDVRESMKTTLLSTFSRREKIQNFTSPNLHKDGTIIVLETTGLPLYNPAGTFDGYRGIALDITDRKMADDAVKKANKQLILLNSITRHDILNQLNTFSGYLAITKKMSSDSKMTDMLQKEEEVAETIRRMITFTRDYQSIGVQPPQWQNVSDILQNVLTITDKGGISVGIDSGELEVYADKLIEKVFFNLIENSIRHGVTVKTIHIGYTKKDRDVVIIYEDNGLGIPSEEKEKIFDTGYGLFLAREVLAITGLSISETGSPGKGARFEIIVPAGSFRINETPGNTVIL